METCRGTQYENGDGNEKGIREGGGEPNKRMKPHKTCRRDQSYSFRTRHHLCRSGVALAGTRKLRSQARGLYTHIKPRGQPGTRRTGSGAGFKAGTETQTGTGSGAGRRT